MKLISLLIVCLFLGACSSDSNPAPGNEAISPTPQSLILRAWEATEDGSNYNYRVELHKNGQVVAHVSQLKSSPIFITNKEKKIVQKQDAQGFSIVQQTLWRETIESTATPNELANKNSLGAVFFKTLDLNSITTETNEISYSSLVLKTTENNMVIPKIISGVFTPVEDQWVFTAAQAPALSLTYEKSGSYDYQVSVSYPAEDANTFLRRVTYSRTQKDTPSKESYNTIDTLEKFRQSSAHRLPNGHVIEFQTYKKVNGEYIPQSDIYPLYMPIFQLDANAIQWKLNLEPRSWGGYSGTIQLSLPYDIEPYQIPKIAGRQTIIEKHAAAVLSFNLNEEFINPKNILLHFSDAVQGSKINVYADLNTTHRYFEPRYASYEIAKVPFYYLELIHLKFACVKEGPSYKISWISPDPFEMKALVKNVDGEVVLQTQYSGQKNEHVIFMPATIGTLTSRLQLTYKDIYTNEDNVISYVKYLSTICEEN